MRTRSSYTTGRLMIAAGTLMALSASVMAAPAANLMKNVNDGATTVGAAAHYAPSTDGRTYYRLPNGKAVFFGAEATTGGEPWVTDGTAAGTQLLRDMVPGAGASALGVAFFAGQTQAIAHFIVDETTGKAVFLCSDAGQASYIITDGTPAGTQNLLINPARGDFAGATIFGSNLQEIGSPGAAAAGRWLLTANSSTTATANSDLAVTTDTPGTATFIDLNPSGAATPRAYRTHDNRFISFVATDGVNGLQWYLFDATLPVNYTQATNTDAASNPRRITNFNQSTPGSAGAPGFLPAASLRATFPGNANPTTRIFLANATPTGDAGGAGVSENFWFYEVETQTLTQATAVTRSAANNPPIRTQWDPIFAGPAGAEKLYFLHNATGPTGTRLWVHDPFVAGPNATNLASVNAATFPRRGTAIPVTGGTRLVFAGGNTTQGLELWTSDGTPAGTVRVTDLAPGTGAGMGTTVPPVADATLAVQQFWPTRFWTIDNSGTFFFSGTDVGTIPGVAGQNAGDQFSTNTAASQRQHLWRAVASPAGVTLTAGTDNPIVFNPVTGVSTTGTSSLPTNLVSLTGGIVVSAFDSVNGREPHRTDLTQANSGLLLNIAVTRPGSAPLAFTSVGTTGTFFGAARPQEGYELYLSTDDTPAGTALLKDINTFAETGVGFPPGATKGSVPFFMREVNGQLVFGATTTPDFLPPAPAPTTGEGYELWRSDGTNAGTVQIADFAVGVPNGFPHIATTNATLFGTNVNFGVVTGGGPGLDQYVVVGSDGANRVLASVNTNNTTVSTLSSVGTDPFGFTDGTAAVPQNAYTQTPPFLVVGSKVYLSYADNNVAIQGLTPAATAGGGGELFVWDTATSTLSNVADINLTPGFGSNPGLFTAFDNVGAGVPVGSFFFYANPGSPTGSEPHIFLNDGSNGGLGSVASLGNLAPVTDAGSRVAFAPVVVGGRVWFSATSAGTGAELAVSDGTPGGTSIIELEAGAVGSTPGPFGVVGNFLVFDAATTFTGFAFKLHALDTTQPVAYNAANPTLGNSNPYLVPGQNLAFFEDSVAFTATNYKLFDGRLYYTGINRTNGVEVWSTDGLTTALAFDINPGNLNSNPTNYQVTGGKLYFNADDGTNGVEPWVIRMPSGPVACNPADIAQTDGTPGADACVNNGDFSLFFSTFFSADCSATCGILPVTACNPADIAATDGSVGADGCVDNGDFSLFFSEFFSAVCPDCAG